MELGNVLDVSDGIKNGRVRLDNIAPMLSISPSRSGSSWRWKFSFDDSDGSGFQEVTRGDVSCLSVAPKNTSSESYNAAANARYGRFDSSYYTSVTWKLVSLRLLTLTVNGDNVSASMLHRVGSSVWLKITAEDNVGNHVWGGPGADACYILVKAHDGPSGPFSLSVVLKPH